MLPRPALARWSSHFFRQTARTSRPLPRRPNTRSNLFQSRRYASESGGEHAEHKSGSDLPWAIGSIVVTVPATWYLLQPQLNKQSHGHGHGHDDDSHGEHGATDSEHGDDGESKDDEKAESASDDSDESGKDTPETSDDEGSEASKDSSGDDGKAKTAGEKDPAAVAKEPGGFDKQSGKQEGLSNQDTGHSINVKDDDVTSKKIGGEPDTAKLKGTVPVQKGGES